VYASHRGTNGPLAPDDAVPSLHVGDAAYVELVQFKLTPNAPNKANSALHELNIVEHWD
jgi:hypothetical protein